MSKLYGKTHQIKFTEISEKYKVSKSVKGKISELHALLITYVSSNFKNTNKYKQMVVDALNLITYAVYADEPLPFNWSPKHPFDNIPDVDEAEIEAILGPILLSTDSIRWDVEDTLGTSEDVVYDNAVAEIAATTSVPPKSDRPEPSATRKVVASPSIEKSYVTPTNKQDLYIQPPSIPQFDYNHIWMSGTSGADNLVIYNTLPTTPTKQNEISCTTAVTQMTYEELMNLYPNCTIHTRSSVMYEPHDNMKLDETLGIILPISGYEENTLVDNLIQYPHLFKLSRLIDGKFISFYSNIEIDGELYNTLDIWDTLPESKVIPKQTEFVKEYVVRRYLLERDVKKVKHMYPIFGLLDPYLTLFMTPSQYINYGYTDVEKLARECVLSRVRYKQSRNPVIRRLTTDV